MPYPDGTLGVDGTATGEGATERDLVRVLEVPADRQPAGQPGHHQVRKVAQQSDQVGRRGLTLEIRVGGEDDLADTGFGDPSEQRSDAQLVRSDAVDRRDGAPQDVVA